MKMSAEITFKMEWSTAEAQAFIQVSTDTMTLGDSALIAQMKQDIKAILDLFKDDPWRRREKFLMGGGDENVEANHKKDRTVDDPGSGP